MLHLLKNMNYQFRIEIQINDKWQRSKYQIILFVSGVLMHENRKCERIFIKVKWNKQEARQKDINKNRKYLENRSDNWIEKSLF